MRFDNLETTVKTPWAPHTEGMALHLDYFEGSMFDRVKSIAEKYPEYTAFDFMGSKTSYRQLVNEIETCAKALKTIGVREGDKVTIAMPNCPQAIEIFYAVNLVGGICNMIHPLSAEKEIEFYLNESESVTAITLDQFYNKFESIRNNTKVVNIIIASVKDALSKPIKAGYMLTSGRKIKKIPSDAPVIMWREFKNMAKCCFYNYKVEKGYNDPAVILYSGGTTGTTKGIVLTNGNFNSLAEQIITANPMFMPGDKMLAAMPLFHGFGLGVCVHSMLANGGRCILIPRFTAKTYAKDLVRHRCNFVAGVPTLYEALLRLPQMERADLSCLKGVFSGGDSLTPELKKKLDKFLYTHHAAIQVREGYGTTETVTACCLTWVYTGDLGYMDSEGFVYFRGRAKRMIITSGYNVYPATLENIFDAHPDIQMSCIIGVPDSLKMQKIKAFVMLKPGIEGSQEEKEKIMEYARQNIAKYALPYDIEFKPELPKTLVGKVAYRVLEEEELAKLKRDDIDEDI